MSKISWKEAATLIILARNSLTSKLNIISKSPIVSSVISSTHVKDDDRIKIKSKLYKFDYQVMMVKRSNLSSFMASAYVYPGGAVEKADFSLNWFDVFTEHGYTQGELIDVFNIRNGVRPPMITDPLTIASDNNSQVDRNKFLPAEIAFRIAAIRETFEETGILLLTCRNREQSESLLSDLDDSHIDLTEWREKVRKDANEFIKLCKETNLYPDIWSLYEWSNWLTPISVGHKRFDTIFYVCCLETQPKVVLDNKEITTLKWSSPSDIIVDHLDENIFLAPPQVYELSRLQNYTNYDHLKQYIIKRQQYGIERWLPYLSTYKDGSISYLPGDDLYPKGEHDLKPVPDYPQTLTEMQNKVNNINRIELRGTTSIAICNIKLACNQLSPITSPFISESIISRL